MDEVSWVALTLTLTLLAGAYTWWAFRNRGVSSGMRGVALTLLPIAGWLTGTLALGVDLADSVGRWMATLVLSPLVWLGIALAVVSVLLFLAAGRLPNRQAEQRKEVRGKTRGAVAGGRPGRASSPVDDDLADIEALLRKRGIE